MRAEASPIFRGGHETVICDVVRVLFNVGELVMRPISAEREHHRDMVPTCGSGRARGVQTDVSLACG
jgi:hypothetical protein